MSWRAMEAVQDHSRYQTRQQYYEFRVMLALASFADERGVVGVEGQYEACPSQTALAERAHVHRNTVNKVLPTLLADGELAVVARGGSGRGTWAVTRSCCQWKRQIGPVVCNYGKNLHAAPESRVRKSCNSWRSTRNAMAREIAHLRALIAHGISTNGTRRQKSVQDPILDPLDPVDRDRTRAGTGTGESPFLLSWWGRGIAGRAGWKPALLERELARRAGAIAEVCRLDMRVASHRAQCEAAAQLRGLSGIGSASVILARMARRAALAGRSGTGTCTTGGGERGSSRSRAGWWKRSGRCGRGRMAVGKGRARRRWVGR